MALQRALQKQKAKPESVSLKGLKRTDKCPNCPNSTVIEDHRAGDRICQECGLVIGDRVVDVGSEWRSFSDSKGADPNRVGAAMDPLFDQDMGIKVSSIPGSSSDMYGDALTRGARSGASGAERTLKQAYREISQMASRLNLPDSMVTRSKKVYKMAKDTSQVGGHSFTSLAAAALYIACRQENVARSFKEICAVAQQKNQTKIGRAYKKIMAALNIKLDGINETMFMLRFCNKLGMDRKQTMLCNEVAKRAVEIGVVEGKVPTTIAAAAIFMTMQAIGFNKTKEDVSVVTGVAEGTIRNAYREMYPVREYLFINTSISTKDQSLLGIKFLGEAQKVGGLDKAKKWAKSKGHIIKSATIKEEPNNSGVKQEVTDTPTSTSTQPTASSSSVQPVKPEPTA